MAWLKITVECPASEVDPLITLFEQFESVGISSTACSDEKHYAGVDDDPVYWKRTAVTALLHHDIDLDILLACIRNRIGTENILDNKIEYLKDENWLDMQKRQHQTLVFADRLCIRPSWESADTDYEAQLVLDPGLAFGTGKHATTSLCLEWLASHELDFETLIDYGCGSGILSLAAAALGVPHVYALDIDSQAISATRSNAESNGLEQRVHASMPGSFSPPPADCLVANILLNPLLELAETMQSLVRTKGWIVLSGILATQTEECMAAYSPWFTMQTPEYRDEWALLQGTRRA